MFIVIPIIYSKKLIFSLKNMSRLCQYVICDLEGYFLYVITHDDSDARFSNNLNILYIYIKYSY